MGDARAMKIAAAAKAVTFVEEGMRLGIGTGSTADEFIRLLAERINQGLDVIGVATSLRSEKLCAELGVPLATLEELPQLDLVIDGADEIGPHLSLIKGGGGALLREKIVASAASQMLVIADESKVVSRLGAFPLPIEINPFGLEVTRRAIETTFAQLGLEGALKLRLQQDGAIFVTDGGHYILDAHLQSIEDPYLLSQNLLNIAGVVQHGLFLDMASTAIIAAPDATITILERE